MFDLAPEEARLLLDVALLATGRNRFHSAAKILAALERFRSEGKAVVIAADADRVVGIRAGEIVFDGPSSMITKELLDEIYGGSTVPTSKDEQKAKEA